MSTKLLDSVEQTKELAAYLRKRSVEICSDNGCTEDEHRCESYAYVRCDMRLLDICASDYFQGCAEPHAAVPLPFTGDWQDLTEEVSNQCEDFDA